MSENKDSLPLETYFKLMTMNGGAYVFNIAQKMNLLSPFKESEFLSAKEISTSLGLESRGVYLVLETLISIGILERKEELYNLAPVTKLLTGSYENLSSDYWEHLPIFLKSGAPYKKMDQVSDSEKEYQSQVKALEWMMKPCARQACELITLKPNSKVLDIGAGSGVWSLSFLEKYSTSLATLVDWPAVLEVAKDSAQKASLNTRVNFIEGNYHEVSFGEELHDLAILGNVTHIETPEGNKKLFQKISSSLKPGAKLAIFDCYSENKEGQLARSLYELGLAIRTKQGQVYSVELLKSWLIELGYDTFEFNSLEVIPYTMGVLLATKK